MRFIIDAQLPPVLACLLSDLGHEAEHVSKIKLLDASDEAIWDYALAHDSVIVSKDEDFPHRQSQSAISPVVVWLRIGNTSRRGLLTWVDEVWPRVETLINEGNRLIEVR